MPEQINNASASTGSYISNALEDMVQGSIGPEQADVRVNVCEYVSFDYAGTMSNDPVVAVHMNLSPLDGSNEGKDFDVEWTVGPKMADFDIGNDGGNLVPKGARQTLAPTSNWATLLRAMTDISFKTEALNGPRGIRGLEGMEMTIRRIKQTNREGLSDKTDKGRDKTFYTCLKIMAMPGETKKGTGTRRAAAPAQSASAPPQAPPATQAGSNGAGNPLAIISYINSSLAESNNSIALADLPRLVFKHAKAAGASAKAATDTANQTKSEDFLYEHAMDQGWTIENGVLTSA